MYRKELKDKKSHNNPYRPVNFVRGAQGNPVCPNGKFFHSAYLKPVKGNKYGRQE